MGFSFCALVRLLLEIEYDILDELAHLSLLVSPPDADGLFKGQLVVPFQTDCLFLELGFKMTTLYLFIVMRDYFFYIFDRFLSVGCGSVRQLLMTC